MVIQISLWSLSTTEMNTCQEKQLMLSSIKKQKFWQVKKQNKLTPQKE
jgi:hypothetical protein